jgi:hypothetical protein
MNGACGTDGEGRGIHRVLVEKRGGGDYLEDVGADGKVILKLMFKKWNKEGTDWNELVQDRNRWHMARISECLVRVRLKRFVMTDLRGVTFSHCNI